LKTQTKKALTRRPPQKVKKPATAKSAKQTALARLRADPARLSEAVPTQTPAMKPSSALRSTATLLLPLESQERAPAAAASQNVRVNFVLLDLGAKHVALCGDFNGWALGAMPMKRNPSGHWEATVELVAGRYEYKFVVDGQWIPDPLAREQVWNYHGTLNSVIEVPG